MGLEAFRNIVRRILENPKWKAAVIWGIAIGCFDIFVNVVVGRITWKSSNTIYVVSVGPLIALIFIGLFSYFYLRSILLGALCGITCAIPYFFYSLSFILQTKATFWWMAIPASIFSAFIFATPGIIGGYLAEKKESKCNR